MIQAHRLAKACLQRRERAGRNAWLCAPFPGDDNGRWRSFVKEGTVEFTISMARYSCSYSRGSNLEGQILGGNPNIPSIFPFAPSRTRSQAVHHDRRHHIPARAALASSRHRAPPNYICAPQEQWTGVCTVCSTCVFLLRWRCPARLPAGVRVPAVSALFVCALNNGHRAPRCSLGPQPVPDAAFVTSRQLSKVQPNSCSSVQARTSIPCAGALGSTPRRLQQRHSPSARL